MKKDCSATPSSPDDILIDAQAVKAKVQDAQITFQLGNKSIVVRDVCDKVVNAISAARDVGTAVASLNPYAALAWSGLQFFLQTFGTAKEIRDMCWDVLPRATYLIRRYQTLEQVYTSEKHMKTTRGDLELALVEAYVLVVRYQTEMIIYLNKAAHRVKTSFFKSSDSKLQTLWTSIQEKQTVLDSLQISTNREIDSSYYRELHATSIALQKILDQTWDKVQEISRKIRAEERRKFLEWILDFKYVDMHRAERRAVLRDTGQCLLTHPTYRDWV